MGTTAVNTWVITNKCFRKKVDNLYDRERRFDGLLAGEDQDEQNIQPKKNKNARLNRYWVSFIKPLNLTPNSITLF